MIYTLKNDLLTVDVSTLGAQIMSVRGCGCEYIWQGDPAFWAERAPLMFPICGRLYQGKYSYEGKEYSMGLHGFARACEFSVSKATDTRITLSLCSSAHTLAQYPFEFELAVSYLLTKNTLTSAVAIKNTGSKTLPAAFGAHPGFNVPLDCGSFDEWYIEFCEDCTPNKLILSDSCLNTGKRSAYALTDSRKLPLSHSLFEHDAIFLDRVAPAVTLKCDRSERSVTLRYPQMPYLGLWHAPATPAPYVCIEPWCGLPSFDAQHDEIMTKNDMFHILAGKSKEITYSIEFN